MKTINEQRDDILNGSHFPDVSVSGGEMGNTTQSKGMRLAQIEAGWPNLIEDVMTMMPEEQKKLIEHRYFKGYSPDIVADKLYISRRLYYAWKDNVIYNIVLMATKKGMIDPFE